VFDNVLLVSIALKNSEAKEAELPVVEYSKFSLVDAAGAAKHFPLQRANGHYLAGPISDWNGGGRWYPHVPAKGGRVLFALFKPLKPGTKAAVHVPGLPTFDDVDLMAMAGSTPDEASAPRGTVRGQILNRHIFHDLTPTTASATIDP